MLGHDRDCYMLAFDHRGSVQEELLGIKEAPTREEADRISETQRLIFEGFPRSARPRAIDAYRSAAV